jgi:hypothetical protein
MSASIDSRKAAPTKQDTLLDAPSIATVSERVTPEHADGHLRAFLISLGIVVMDFTAVDSFLFVILLVVKDVLLVEEDIFQAVATRVLLWARHMVVVVVDSKDPRLVFQVKDRLKIAQFHLI